MFEKRCRGWYRVMLSLTLAFLFGWLTSLALSVAPVAATHELSNMENELLGKIPLPATDIFTVTGIVKDMNGTPVDGVEVFAFSGAFSTGVSTDAAGRYTLTLTAGNFYDIVFNPPLGTGLATQVKRGIGASQTLNVTLLPGHAISGTVYDGATGSRVPNVAIFAFNKDTFEGFGLPPTGEDGTYQISLAAGAWELTFTPPPSTGLGPKQITITVSGDIILDVILPAGFTVYGQVMTSGGGAQANVEIFAQDPAQPNGFGFSPTGPTGLYTGTLPIGTFDIQFLAPPFRRLGSTVVTNVVGPPDVELNVTLPAGLTVSGTIRCRQQTLTNTFVFAAPDLPVSAGFFGGWGRFAGADGFYALALQTGIYTFIVTPPDGNILPRFTVPMVEVQADLTLNFDHPECESTLVTLISFEAVGGESKIRLSWETASEVENAGFNLYRALAATGPWARLNESLIEARGNPDSGAGYVYTDTNVIKGINYFYKLEDVDLYGMSFFHGPVTAIPSPEHQLFLPLIFK